VAVLIKDDEADRLVRELAARTGETITEAVKTAVAERLKRLPLTAREIAARRRRLDSVLAKADALPNVDRRSPDAILGFNDQGHFD
jgi:antitoxin VapB